MQLSLYLGLMLVFIALHFIIRYIERDNQYKLIYHLFMTFIFLGFTILSFYNYTLVYDASLGSFVKHYEADDGLQPFIYFFISLFFTILSAFSIITDTGEEWRRLFKGKEMKRKY